MLSRTQATLLPVFFCLLSFVSVNAVQAQSAPSGACLYALDPSASQAFSVSGSTTASSGCSIVVESSASNAFYIGSSETLSLGNHSRVGVVGGSQVSGQLIDSISNQQVQPVSISNPGDPLAYVQAPTTGSIVSSSPVSYSKTNPPPNNTLSPGVYCGGLSISNTNGVQFTMSPGTYILAGGGLQVTSSAILVGSGVTIYNTSSSAWNCPASYAYTPIMIDGQAKVTLSAPTSGALDGIVIFGDRQGCSTPGSCVDDINGKSTATFNGAVYLKGDELLVNGSSTTGGCIAAVADTIVINGNSTFGGNSCALNAVSVTVSPSSSVLYAGQQQTFSANVTNTYFTDVTWAVSSGPGSINASGNYTAPATITTPQTVTVTATSQSDTSASGSATITLYPPITVSITPTTATLHGGGTQQFSAAVANAVNTAVTWTTSGPGSVSSSGLYTAPISVTAPQTVTITATSQANSSANASITITLYPPVAVSVSPSTSVLYANGTQPFTATVSNAANTAVNWTVSGPGSINTSGIYTAPATITTQQAVTVTATSQADSTAAATATITLYPPIAVTVTPASGTLYANGTLQLSASVSNAASTGVNWTVSGPGAISASGLYTAPTSVTSQQSVTITATSQVNASASASITITLYPPVAVAVSPATASLYAGGAQKFSATVSNATNTAVNWTVSGPGSVDSTGLYTAPAAIGSQQTATVTATSQSDTTAAASAIITLLSPVAVVVSPTTATLSSGGTQQFTATVTGSSNTAVTWTVSPTGTGTIDATGFYTAPASILNPQTVTVTATSVADTTKSATATISLSAAQCTTSAFSHRRILTVDHTKVPNTDQTDFPILVAGTYPFLRTAANGGEVQNTNGYDIIFTSDPQGQNPLDFEIDSYNATTGAVAFWVRIPTLSHTADTPIYIWYGNSSVTTSQEDKAGVWRNNFLSVYHLGNGSSLGLTDSGSGGYNLSGSASAVGGVIGGGAGFNGSSSLIHDNVSTYPSGSSPVTIEGWVNITPNTTGGDIFGYGANSANGSRIAFGTSSTSLVLEFENQGIGVALPTTGTWHHIVGVYGGGALSATTDNLYVDGVALPETSSVGTPAITTNEFKIGGIPTVGSCCTFTGSVDEVRVSSGARSADWVTAEYNSEASPSTFYSLSAEDAVAVNPASLMLYASQNAQFTATPLNACTAVNWTVAPSGVGAITSGGIYTAPSNISAPQLVTVTATTATGPVESGSAAVSLAPPIAVTVNPSSAAIVDGNQPLQLTATVANTGNTAVTWSISPSGVGTISTSGLYIAPQPLPANQTVTVTATSQANSSISASAILTLGPTGLVATPPSATICAATGYTAQRMIVIDHAKISNTDQVNFPFLFNSTDPAFATTANGGKMMSYAGDDILFSLDPNGTEKLDYEIQSYDPVHGQIIAWVRIPTLSHTSDTVIYLFYGNPNVTGPQANPTGVWDSNYQAVYHLQNPASSVAFDSTSHANNGTAANLAPVQSLFGPGAIFNSSYIDLPQADFVGYPTSSSPGYSPYTATFQTWFKTTAGGIILEQDGGGGTPGGAQPNGAVQALTVTSSGNLVVNFFGSDRFGWPITTSGVFNDNDWHLATLTTLNNLETVYVDDQVVGTWNMGYPFGGEAGWANSYNYYLGTGATGGWNFFNGDLEEVEISNSARSSDWIAAEYRNQSSPSTFYKLYSAYPGNISLSPPVVNLYGGQSQQFVASATGSCVSPAVVWSGSAGMPGTLTADGLYFAPASIDTQQTLTLTATTVGDASTSVTATVTLLPPVSVGVTPLSGTLAAGQTQQLVATVSNAANTSVTWTVNPAGVGSISPTGLYTAPSTISATEAVNVTATSQADPSQSATATLSLTSPAPVLPVTVAVTPSSATVYAGQSNQFTATVANSSNTAVTWQISPAGVGAVTTAGVYTAPTTITTQQTVTITATSQADPTKSAWAILTLSPASCASSGYSYERTITINHAQVHNTDQTNFPVLISTTDPLLATTSNGGHVTSTNGYDILFSADPNGVTKLDYEIEQYNPATGQVVAWVRVPSLSHSADTTIYLFYGNSSIAASQQNPTGVWDINYLDVLHLDETTGTTVFDSTTHANNATKLSQSSPAPISAGQIGGAQSFNGTSDYIVLQQPMTNGLQKFSVSFWAQTTDTNSNGTYWNQDQFVGDSTPGNSSGDFGVGTNSGYLSMWSGLNSANDNSLQAGNYVSDNNWHRIDAVNDGSIIHLYFDGSDTGQTLSSGLALDGYGWYLGAQHYTGGGAAFYHQGAIDEFRLSNAARNADWIATEYNNEKTPSAFYSLGSENVLTISPASISLFGGQSQQFAATGECTSNVTWSMPSGSPGILTTGGLYTAPASVSSPQSVTITATGQNSSTATATVNLLANISVALTPTSVMLSASQSQLFEATVINGSQGVVWSISPAGVGTINSSGLYTAPASITGQTVIVTATSVDDSTKSASATVTLTATGCVSNGYGYQRTIVIDHTKVPNTDQVNFPFLFNTTDPDLATFANGGHVASANGYDIIFSLDPNGLTKLDHEVEQYNPATGQLTAWVRIPTLLHSADTVIYLFYGNTNIATSQANPAGVWDNNTQAIYHLGNLSSGTAPDSTIYGNTGALTSVTQSAGSIDGGGSFNGTGSYIQVPSAAFPNYPTGQYSNIGTASTANSTTFASTFGVWFKTTTAGGLLTQVPAQSCAYVFGICFAQVNTEPGYYDPFGWNTMLYVDTNGRVEANGITSSAAYNDDSWHYAALTHATDGTKILYVDGQNVATQEQDYTGGYSSGYSYFVGTAYTFLNSLGNWNWLYFNGNLDEVSVSDNTRSADWIKTQFNNQSSPSTFYRLSPVGSLTLAPTTASLYASQTQQFVVGGQCGSAIGWTLSSGSPGTLSSSGLYTAPAVISASQTVTISATNITTGTTIGSATVTLLPVPSPITLAANMASPYTVGTSEIFTARIESQSGTPEPGVSVTFTITGANAAIATATTDSSGTATYAYAGSNSGTDSIQASAVVNGVGVNSSSLAVTWNLVITPPIQASVALLPPATLGQGGLMGAFTDNTGAVLQPIAIAGSSRTFLVPAGATRLQLGIDDTLFSDNGGTGYVVAVNGTPVTVAPTSMPWTWVAGGLNKNLQYGYGDGTAPVVAATGLTSGQLVTIAYLSGTVSVSAAARPFTNANGDLTQITGTNISAGLYFPTLYTSASAYPVGEAVDWSAVVTDASGQPVTNTPVTFYVNGVNPGQYSANTDSTGTATFAYTGAYSGTDTLEAQSGSLSSQTGSLTWQTYAAESSPGSLTLSLFATDLSLQDWNVYATDASGNPVANANVGFYVSGVDNFQESATTDVTGHASFGYFHSNPGTYTVVAVDSVNDTVVKTAPQTGTWTVQQGVSSPASNQIVLSISTSTAITLPTNSVALTTTVTDSNGLTPTVTWTQVSGPGTVTFGNNQQASTTATFSQAGVYLLQISATDSTATSASAQVKITVNPPLVTNYSQGWFGGPLYGSQATGVVPVTVESGITLTGGMLVYYPENNIFDVTVLNSNTVGTGQIGTFDTTQLPNGSYILELYATNSQGVSQYNDITLNVVGNYKPGRVTSTVTDLVVPAKGLAISIQRQYDSLNAGTSSDFGYGWSLSTNVGLTVDAHNDVTFKLNGQSHTFFFTPQPFGGSFFQLGTYSVAFTPDSGIHGTLTDDGQGCPLDFVQPDVSLWYCVGGGLYQPSGYIYTDPSGTKYTISAAGNLQSIVDIGGNTLTVTANGITSSTGLSVPFVRDAQGRITQISDPQGNNYAYTYDTAGNLATVKYPTTTQAGTYSYDSNHLYLSGTDFRGNTLPTTGYYGPADTDVNGLPLNGRLKSATDALNETTSYAYNLATNTTTVTYPPDGSGNVGTATMVYDSAGNLLSSTDPNNLTTANTYDATGNLLSVTDPLGKVTSYTYDALGNKTSTAYPKTATSTNTTSTVAYNQFSEPTSSADELGNVRTYNYDANSWPASVTDNLGTLMSSLFNSDGTMSAGAIGYDITANPVRASQFTYDASGNRISTTDAIGRVTLYAYNSLGQKTSMTEPVPYGSNTAPATTNYTYDALGHLVETDAPLGRTTKSTYDANGNKLSDTDADGNVTTYAYDALNRLATTTYPTSPATTVTNTYDFRGNIVTQTDQAGNVTKNQYDLAGRLTSVTKAFGTANAMTTSYTYDNDGRKLSTTVGYGTPSAAITNYAYDAAGNLMSISGAGGNFTYGYDNARNRVSSTDGRGNATTFTYDARKRPMVTTYPDTAHTTVTNTYDGAGNLASVTDQAGNVVTYTYDAASQLQSVVQNNSPNAPQNVTTYGYDLLGNLNSSSDANTHITINGYDLLSEQISKKLPDGSLTESRTYDTAGNLTVLTHFNGVTTTYTYDTLNRLLSRATPGEVTVSHTYTATGKYATTTDASGTTTYTYDTMDRLTSKATPEGTLNYTYDATGRVASITSGNANGASMSYTWDSLNRLSTVVDNRLPTGHNTTTYTYDASSNVGTATYPNGLQSTFTYDSNNRLTELSTPPVADYKYTLGATGNRVATSEQTGRTADWSYDGIYRLTQEQIAGDPAGGNGAVSYGLDPVGDRTSTSSTIPSVLSISSMSFSVDDLMSSEGYDSNGNTTSTGGRTFAYDSENHLTSMNSGAVTIVYDGFGNRVAKTAAGMTTQYLVEDDVNPTGYPQVMDELTNGAVARTYTYGLQRIDEEQQIGGTWTSSFYGYDGGGTVRQLTNVSGAVTDTYNYDAFGNKLNSTGSTPNNYLYRGEQYDPDLKLYYLRARYYNAATGRFLSKDPLVGHLQVPLSLHKYLYAGGNPVTKGDPTGQEELFEDVFVTAKTVKNSAFFANTFACGLNIGLLGASADLLQTLSFEKGTYAGALGWGGLASGTYGCLTVAWSPEGPLATLNDNLAELGCTIGLAQALYDLNEYTQHPTDDNLAALQRDMVGGVVGCALTLVSVSP